MLSGMLPQLMAADIDDPPIEARRAIRGAWLRLNETSSERARAARPVRFRLVNAAHLRDHA